MCSHLSVGSAAPRDDSTLPSNLGPHGRIGRGPGSACSYLPAPALGHDARLTAASLQSGSPPMNRHDSRNSLPKYLIQMASSPGRRPTSSFALIAGLGIARLSLLGACAPAAPELLASANRTVANAMPFPGALFDVKHNWGLVRPPYRRKPVCASCRAFRRQWSSRCRNPSVTPSCITGLARSVPVVGPAFGACQPAKRLECSPRLTGACARGAACALHFSLSVTLVGSNRVPPQAC
jgi:hypothetical protein